MSDPSFFPLSFVYNNGNNNTFSGPSSQIVPPSSSVWYDPHQQVSYVYSPYPVSPYPVSPYPVVWFVKNEENQRFKECEVPRTPSPSPHSSVSSSPVPSPGPSTPNNDKKEESCIMLREVLTDELLKLPQATVAEKLGINSSSFSKKWKREFPGKSWPHRKHKKIDIQLQMLYNRLPYVSSDKEREEIEHLKFTLEEKMRKNLRRPYDDKDDSAKTEKQHKKTRVPISVDPSVAKTAVQRATKRRRVAQFTGACLDPTL